MRISWLVTAVVLGTGGAAWADDDPEQPLTEPAPTPVTAPPPVVVAPPPPPPPVVVAPASPPKPLVDDPAGIPSFVTLDRWGARSRAGAELQYPFLAGEGTGRASLYKLDVFGEYVGASGFGVYGQVPFSILHLDGGTGVDSQTAAGVGDLEAGLLYVIHDTGQQGLSLIAHFGLTAPLASDTLTHADGTVGAGAANLLGTRGRLNDLYLAVPGGFSVRAGLAGIYKRGAFFARAELAGDFNIDQHNGESFNTDYVYPVVRLNFAGGYDGGKWSAGGELVNLIVTDRTQRTVGVDVFSLMARLQTNPKTQPYLGITFPVDEESQRNINFVFTLGVDTKLD